jgi:hypothetical protein
MNQEKERTKIATAFFAVSIALSSAFAAESFVTWNGANGNPQIQTGLGNWTETFGYWFFYTDKNDGDGSNVMWAAAMDPPYYAFDPVIEECNGFCGTAVLKGESAIEKPFVGFGFSVVGETSDTDHTLAAGDASAWNGLCITYTSDVDLLLQLGPGPISDPNGWILDGEGPDAEPALALSYPSATLPASKTSNLVRVAWSDFKQIPSHLSSPIIDGETASKQLSIISFKLQADPGSYDFKICAIGPQNGTCPEKCTPSNSEQGIQNVREAVAAKAILNGRTLSFTGIKSTATAVVLNSLGQVVARGAIEGTAPTLNLAHLDAGIYMIHVTGKAVNFTNRIVVR